MDPAAVADTRRSLSEDAATNIIYRQDTFIENSHYFDSLPFEVMAMLVAIQQMGPSPDRPRFCSQQCAAFMEAYRQTRSVVDIEMAVALGAMAVKYMEPQDPYSYLYVHDFATALRAKWERDQDINILKKAIYYGQKTAKLLEESDTLLFSILLETLTLSETLFEKEETQVNYEAAIAAYRKAIAIAIAIAEDNLKAAMMIANQGEFIRVFGPQFATSPITALSEAIEVQLQAVERISTVDLLIAGIIHRNAGRTFASRFKITVEDIDFKTAVSHYEEALGCEAFWRGRQGCCLQ
jgi:tetratricopeptide (TPR) repeat protein